MIDYEKTARLELRCSESTKILIKEAARICDTTMTNWIIAVCTIVAEQTIANHNEIMGILENDYQ